MRKKLSQEDVKLLIMQWNEGEKQEDLAKEYQVSQTLISRILNRKARQDVTYGMFIRVRNQKETAEVSMVYNPH